MLIPVGRRHRRTVLLDEPVVEPPPPTGSDALRLAIGGVWLLQEDYGQNYLANLRTAVVTVPEARGLAWRYYADTACDSNGDLNTTSTGRVPQWISWAKTINAENPGKDYKVSLRVLNGKQTPASVLAKMPAHMKFANGTRSVPHPCYTQVTTHSHDGLPTHTHQIGEPNDVFEIWFTKHITQLVEYLDGQNILGADKLVPFIHGAYYGSNYSEFYNGPEIQAAAYSSAQMRAAHFRLVKIVHDILPADVATEWANTGHGPMVGTWHDGNGVGAQDNPFIDELATYVASLYGEGNPRVYLSYNGWWTDQIGGGGSVSDEYNKQYASRYRPGAPRILAELQDIVGTPIKNFDWNQAFEWAYPSTTNILPDTLTTYNNANPARRTLGRGRNAGGADDYLRSGVGPAEIYVMRTLPGDQTALNRLQIAANASKMRAHIRALVDADPPDPEPPDPEDPPVVTDPDPDPKTGTYSNFGTRTITTDQGETVVIRYPTNSSGVMIPDRPLVYVGHGMGQAGTGTSTVLLGLLAQGQNKMLVDNGYVACLANIDSISYTQKAQRVVRAVKAVLADSTMAPGILPNRVGYYGGSQGAITGVALLDSRYRPNPEPVADGGDGFSFDGMVLRSPMNPGVSPSYEDAPPILIMLGTQDPTVTPNSSRSVYTAASAPKGKIELPGAAHDLVEPTPTNIVRDASLAFFSRVLGGVSTGFTAIQTAVNADVNNPAYDFDWTLDVVVTDPEDPDEPPPPPTGKNSDWIKGTKVVQQLNSRALWTTAMKNDLADILQLDGVTALSMRYPYHLAKSDPALLDEAKAIADAAGKKIEIRTMTARYLDTATLNAIPAAYKMSGVYQGSNITVAMPYNTSTGTAGNPVYEQRWKDEILVPQAAWARANGSRLLHCSWHGWAWAEVWHDFVMSGNTAATPPIPPGPGYTWEAWLEGYRRVAALAIDVAGEDLMVEFALSGHLGQTPINPATGSRYQVGDELVKLLQTEANVASNTVKSELFVVQGNGMGKVNGAPTRRAAWHGKQMWNGTANPDTGAEYNWDTIYDALEANGELYLEVYRESFSRTANNAALKRRAAAATWG